MYFPYGPQKKWMDKWINTNWTDWIPTSPESIFISINKTYFHIAMKGKKFHLLSFMGLQLLHQESV